MTAGSTDDNDLLSALLRRISLRGRVYSRPVGCGDWQVNPSGHARASYHLVASGTCWLHFKPPAAPVALAAGDLLFFSEDVWHLLSASREPHDALTRLPAVDGGSSVTQLVCGLYAADDNDLRRLLRGLPPWVLIRSAAGGARLATLVAMLAGESDEDAPGAAAVRDALSDALLALVLRHCLQTEQVQGGLLSALRDPRLAPLLSDLHAEPGAQWNVERMAERAALSRSALAERFRNTVGCAPVQYLAELRMQEASRLLRSEGLSVAAVAERLGYGNEAAFRRAFRRVAGTTPGTLRTR